MSFFSTRLLGFAAVAALLAVAATGPGCTYSHGDPLPCTADTLAVTYSAVVSPIIKANCRDACHNTANYQTLGGFQNYDVFATLQGQALTGRLMSCLRHEPGYPAMPQGQAKLSDCDLARIQAWVNAGALNN
jgi:hypothetical protein